MRTFHAWLKPPARPWALNLTAPTDSPAQSLQLTGHAGSINSLSFSSDGGLLASASSDGTIKARRGAVDDPYMLVFSVSPHRQQQD